MTVKWEHDEIDPQNRPDRRPPDAADPGPRLAGRAGSRGPRRAVPVPLAAQELRRRAGGPLPAQPGRGLAHLQDDQRPPAQRADDHLERQPRGGVLPVRLGSRQEHAAADPGLERLLLAGRVQVQERRDREKRRARRGRRNLRDPERPAGEGPPDGDLVGWQDLPGGGDPARDGAAEALGPERLRPALRHPRSGDPRPPQMEGQDGSLARQGRDGHPRGDPHFQEPGGRADGAEIPTVETPQSAARRGVSFSAFDQREEESMDRKKLVAAVAVMFCLALVGCKKDDQVNATSGEATDQPAADTAAPASEPPPPALETATATLQGAPTDTDFTGTITFTPDGNGVKIVADLQGVDTDGPHGFHVHQTGECTHGEGDKHFTSAGGHFNPANAEHACPPTEPR